MGQFKITVAFKVEDMSAGIFEDLELGSKFSMNGWFDPLATLGKRSFL